MRIDIALIPGQPVNASSSVCVVVDTLRASSTIVTILHRGADAVLAAGTIDEAQALHERFPEYLLCGERGGTPPAGFDYGNSPAEYSALDLAGRSVILATSNGTRMLAALAPKAPVVLVGALVNRSAVGRAAFNIAARDELDITIVCAGEQGGKVFALEDALGAGAIADVIAGEEPTADLTDAARFASSAFRGSEGQVAGAVRFASHARGLIEAGFTADVEFCSRTDSSQTVPAIENDEGILRIVRIDRKT